MSPSPSSRVRETLPPDLAAERRDVFARMVETARTPGARLVVVGEPGLGKSHLVDALVRTLPPDHPVLFVRARGEATEPFAGVADLLDTLPDTALPGGAADAVRREVAGRRRDVAPPPTRRDAELADAVAGALAHLARGPVAVVVDEWQWLDQETLTLLEDVLTRPAIRDRVAVVAAGRRPRHGNAPHAEFFAPDQVVRLDPLGPSSIVRVLSAAGLTGVPVSTLAAIAEDSGGNPLWAMALATARVTGDPRGRSARSPTERRGERLDALPPAVRRLLATVALMGGGQQDDLVQLDHGTGAASAEALRLSLLRTDAGVLTVAEPLLARAAVQGLTPDEERSLHRSVSELPLPLPQRVEHRDRSRPPGVDEVLASELVRAARRARRTGTPDTALRLLRRSLERTAPGTDTCAERTVEATEVALASGDAEQAAELVRELDPVPLSLPTLDRAARVLAVSTDRSGGPTAVARRFLALEHGLDPGSAAWGLAEVHRLSVARATDGGPAAWLPPTLSGTDAPQTLAAALTGEARRRLDQGHGVDRALLARLRDLDSGAGPLETTADALVASWAYQADDLETSRTALTAHVRAARLAGEPYAVVNGLAHAATLETLTGHLGLAQTLLAEAVEHAGTLPGPAPGVDRARALLALADDDRAALDELLAGPHEPGALRPADLLRAEVHGLDLAADGRWAEAVDELGRVRALTVARGVTEPGRRLWVDVELARALVHLGRPTEAADVADALTELGSRPGRVHARGQALRVRALLTERFGDLTAALRLSERALADLEAGGYRPQLVRAQLERVSMLAAAERRVQARGLLGTATKLASGIGHPRLLAEAVHLGARLSEADGRTALTPGELRVAQAVASGQSNRDIAADLFVSVRTVETHLANAYRKLGVRTRTQLALSLNDLPLGSGTPVSRRSP